MCDFYFFHVSRTVYYFVIGCFVTHISLDNARSITVQLSHLNHTQLALALFSRLSTAVVRHKTNDGVVDAI